MLTALSIRDIVLIEKLDLVLEPGLTVLTGETGAGKSIVLDALGLAFGARGAASLVRAGAERGVVTAVFQLSGDHAGAALLQEQGIDTGDEIIVRRIQTRQGTSKAMINDQPVSVSLLARFGRLVCEIHGQHDDRAMMDPAQHLRLVDAYGALEAMGVKVRDACEKARDAGLAVQVHRDELDRAGREREFLEHAATELRALAPVAGEEQKLASQRQLMMNAGQYLDVLAGAQSALGDDGTLEARLNAALRKLERRRDGAGGRLDEACAALERVVMEMAEARQALGGAAAQFSFDERALDEAEERLFALRAAARKHKVEVDNLAQLLAGMEKNLQTLADGGRELARLEAVEKAALDAYRRVAGALSEARHSAAAKLERAVAAELAPLHLAKARFASVITSDEAQVGPQGYDRAGFQISANPGQPLAPLNKVASGGELSRIMLALKVVLAKRGSAPTLIFDEIDTGVGGAVADAIGVRLAALAAGTQVLAVTHSPQVAGRAGSHLLIAKSAGSGADDGRVVTRVTALSGQGRREEIARMLSGARVTDEARAQAGRLISGTG